MPLQALAVDCILFGQPVNASFGKGSLILIPYAVLQNGVKS